MTTPLQMPIHRSADSDRLSDRIGPDTTLAASPLHPLRLANGSDEPSHGEMVANHPYSPSIQGKASQLIRSAQLYELHAAKLQRDPPHCVPPLLMRRILDKLMTRAL
jgi:hypothetical protein